MGTVLIKIDVFKMVKETNEAEIDLIYIDSEGDSHWLNDELALEYHEIHAICEGLKMAHY